MMETEAVLAEIDAVMVKARPLGVGGIQRAAREATITLMVAELEAFWLLDEHGRSARLAAWRSMTTHAATE